MADGNSLQKNATVIQKNMRYSVAGVNEMRIMSKSYVTAVTSTVDTVMSEKIAQLDGLSKLRCDGAAERRRPTLCARS